MKKISTLFFTCLVMLACAQRPEADLIETSKGPLKIEPVFHGAVVFTWNNKTIYVDPYGGPKALEGLAAPDLILITDVHPDHLDLKTLGAIKMDKVTFIVPQAVADKLPANLKAKAVILANGKNTTQQGVSISAIPMYNLPESPDSKHTKGRGNGYIINFGSKMIYISGDTGDIPEMRSLKNIDVAFVCMNLPYTMDVKQAASAVLAFKPKIVYPYHYQGQEGFSDTKEFKKLVNTGDSKIDVRLRSWYIMN